VDQATHLPPSVAAEPYPYPLHVASTALVIIDMQRDFLERGGFGDALGNDVSLLRATIAPLAAVIAAARAAGMVVVHTRDAARKGTTSSRSSPPFPASQ
jgi:nicotinamidase-related amidase